MAELKPESVRLQTDEDVVRARQRVREWSRQQGFSLVNQTKVVTAASELARNTVQYGGGGIMYLEVVNQHSRCGLQLTFEDQGPGIADIEVVLQEGYSTGGGLGLGLPGARRLTDEFELVSCPGAGTRVRIVKWK
jgi:serine/threonine-protein kinase RsbT